MSTIGFAHRNGKSSSAPSGLTVRTFVDPDKTNRVGLIVTVPDLDTLQSALATEAAADAMKFDGVRPETIVMLIES